MRKFIYTITMLAVLAPSLARAAAGPTLAQVREAIGLNAVDAATMVTITGRSVYMGADGTFTLTFATDGRSARAIDGSVSRTAAFDGASAWEIDWNGIPRDLVLGERDEELITMWLDTGMWTAAPAGLIVENDDTNENQFGLRLTDVGIRATVTVDADTFLPRSYAFEYSSVQVTTTLSDYREVNSIQVAHHIERQQSDGGRITYAVDEVKLTSRSTLPTRPDAVKHAATFDTSVPAELALTVAPTQHLMTEVDVNGTPAGWFIFDSGAGANVISTQVAKELSLERVGSTPVMGIGGAVDGDVFKASSLSVGPLSIGESRVVGFDLSPFEPIFNVKLGGIIGYDVFAYSVVEYDFVGPSISLHDPQSFKLESGEWQDLLLYNRTSHVELSFEGHRGVFLMDTGAANSSVAIYAPTVTTLDLLAGRSTEAAQVSGAGGSLDALAGNLAWIELAGNRYENVEASFATENQGVFSDAYISGSVGGKILTNFTLVFDYPRQRMAFVPHGEGSQGAD